MDLKPWIPQILAILCGALVYWKAKNSCDWLVGNTWNKIPLLPDVHCGKTKYIKWAIILLAIVCACSCMRMSSRVRDFFTPSY